MKHFLLYFFALLQINLFSQTANGTTPAADDVIKLDPRASQFDFVPGQILLKLKDDVSVSLAKVNGVTVMGVPSIDAVLQKYKMQNAEKLFPNEKRNFNKRMLKTSNGKEFEQPNLHNIYKVEGDSLLNIFEVINELKEDPNVEYAEPNYILSIVDSKPVSPALTESEMVEWIKEHPEINLTNSNALPMTNDLLTNDQPDQLHKPNVVTPNDPLYSQQWGITACQIDAVWDSTTGDTTQIIAILDTGVDWLHPDLSENIWINPSPNSSPDANGVVNDIRGWDFINNDNNPADDNSHGTHVAGIVAAKGNNGIGIAGVNWKAKIMPIKVFQSSGKGDAATISKGITYASTHGATVINMSFGSFARSLTMENVLSNAYATTVLVAAAGNDGKCIGPGKCPDNQESAPFFPAALSYVLGVVAPPPPPYGFTNYDVDGPVYSGYSDLLNYELKAPGTSIISTIPNGNYRVMSGTSMAAPLVSGAVSLYKHIYPLHSQEMMWGDLINSTADYMKLSDAINQVPKPVLSFVSSTVVDTITGDDKDSRVDAGETIELWYMVRNTWGQSDSVYVGIRFGEFEDTTIAQILKNTAFVGSISTYATRTNESNPLRIKIPSTVANNRVIVFQGLIWYKNSPDTVKQIITLTVENGVQLSGIIDDTVTLTANKYYLVTNSLMISANGVLNINPGVTLNIYDGKTITNYGTLNAIGNKDSMITFKANGSYWTSLALNGDSYLRFCNISGLYGYGFYSYNFNRITQISDCQFINNMTGQSDINLNGNSYIQRTNFYNNNMNIILILRDYANYVYTFNNLNIVNNINGAGLEVDDIGVPVYNDYNKINCFNNGNAIMTSVNAGRYTKIPPMYFGTTDSIKIDKYIWDFFDDGARSPVNYSNYLKAPSDSAHALVWKVLVNGNDPQDGHVDPVGVGPQRFDVYFNREMNPAYTPQLSFGIRSPYTQQFVSDSSFWSFDHKIWTAYKTIQIYTGDGINRLRVIGARDLDNFEIPVEATRFQFLVNAAGSSSNGFNATAGLGKVALDWETPSGVPDLLGYNLYRFNNITDTTFNTPVIVNSSLVTDTLFTDYKVIPNKKYFYYYKIVRTDFTESDSSRVVSTTPYTAALGDGNGDLAVNVLDVLATVSYILGQNPQPFIFDAADVVRDSIINVLDVVGNVNIILKGTLLKNYLAKTSSGNAKVEFTGNKVYLTTDQLVAGIQLQFKGKGLKDAKFIYSGSAAFENMSSSIGDTMQIALMYSLNKNEFAPGKYLIGSIDGDAKDISLSDAVLSDNEGGKINLNLIDNGVSTIPDNYYLDQNYPNPFNLSTTIQYGVPAKTAGKIVIYNILGQQVRSFDLGEREAGRYKIMWDGKNNYGNVISTGVYIFRFESVKFTSAKKMILLK